MFQEMKLCDSNIKKILIFSYISGIRKPEKASKFEEQGTLKNFLNFRKWNF